MASETLPFQHFNIEDDIVPYSDNDFDVVISAEIIEHLLNDPCAVIRRNQKSFKAGWKLSSNYPECGKTREYRPTSKRHQNL